jgi:hypothetical protein
MNKNQEKKKKKKPLSFSFTATASLKKATNPQPNSEPMHLKEKIQNKTKNQGRARQASRKGWKWAPHHALCRAVAADRLEDPDVRRRVDRRKGPARRARAVERARRDGARETHRKAGARDVPHGRAVRRGADNTEDEEEGDGKKHFLYITIFFSPGIFASEIKTRD